MMNLFFVIIGFIVGFCMCGVIADCKHIDVGPRYDEKICGYNRTNNKTE